MYISGGKSKGRKIKAPASRDIRPTSQMIKEAFFEIFRDKVEGSRFLDLFAGFGTVGIEALSRGAHEVVFTDISRHALSIIHQNTDSLKFNDRCSIILADARTALSKKLKGMFDLIFIDPPYNYRYYEDILKTIASKKLLSEDGKIVVEHYHKTLLNSEHNNIIRYRQEKYGQTILSFFEKRKI